jgi:hypothetical protein
VRLKTPDRPPNRIPPAAKTSINTGKIRSSTQYQHISSTDHQQRRTDQRNFNKLLEVKPDAALLSYLVAAWNGLIASELELLHKPPVPQPVDWNHVADYRDLLAAGDRFLDDPSLGFLLIHMPAPHPDGIYDRRTGTFGRAGTSYLDNLALADRYLDHVHQLLEQRGEWDSSTIVIMGDHSWRTKLLWDDSPGWTAEDQAASDGGQFDDRPGYIVKLPHQRQPARIDTPFAAVRTRAMLQQILDGRIQSPAELAAFAELKSGQ